MAVPVIHGYYEFAPTRAQYRKIMRNRKRNLTDSPIGSRSQSNGKDNDG